MATRIVSQCNLSADASREEARLRALRRTELLDSRREEVFDRYVRLASSMTGSPISLISLIDRDRQWFKAGVGLDAEETPREWAFCDHAIRQDGIFEVEDAAADERFADSPLVTGEPNVRAYAGVPLVIFNEGERHAIGTLCVIDTVPKRFTDRQRAELIDLAAVLSHEIETNHHVRMKSDKIAAARAAAIEIEHQMRNMFAKIGAIIDMTAREGGTADDLANAARRRVVALGQANEVALRNDFALAPLSEIVVAALMTAQNKAGIRLSAQGDELNLSTTSASIIAPLVDELAHDALARHVLQDDDAATLEWRVKGDYLAITWSEYVEGDDSPAFAGSFLRKIAPAALHGDVQCMISSEAGGVRRRYRFLVPLALVASEDWRKR